MWRIEFAAAAEDDFDLIFDHLVQSYIVFGDRRSEAMFRAETRVTDIYASSLRICAAPHRGQRHDGLRPGLRQLTLGKATFWFVVDDDARLIRVLAVFFGAQDQQRRMLVRLLGGVDDR